MRRHGDFIEVLAKIIAKNKGHISPGMSQKLIAGTKGVIDGGLTLV